MKLIVLITLLLLASNVHSTQLQLTFDTVEGATSYTIYLLNDDGTAIELETSDAPPMSVSFSDNRTEAAFVVTSKNINGESDYSNVWYWVPKRDIVLNYPTAPETLTINIGL